MYVILICIVLFCSHGPSASSTPQHTSVQSRTHEMLNRQNMEMQMRQQMVQQQQHQQMAGPDAIYYQPQYGAPPPPRSNVNGRLNNTNYETQQQIYGMSKPGPSSQQVNT